MFPEKRTQEHCDSILKNDILPDKVHILEEEAKLCAEGKFKHGHYTEIEIDKNINIMISKEEPNGITYLVFNATTENIILIKKYDLGEEWHEGLKPFIELFLFGMYKMDNAFLFIHDTLVKYGNTEELIEFKLGDYKYSVLPDRAAFKVTYKVVDESKTNCYKAYIPEICILSSNDDYSVAYNIAGHFVHETVFNRKD